MTTFNKKDEGVHYLSEWRGRYCNSPKMLAAINLAIEENGESAMAFITLGTPSQHPDSRCYKIAKGCGWEQFTVYPAVRMATAWRPHRWKNVVVHLLAHSHEYKPVKEKLHDVALEYYSRLNVEFQQRETKRRKFLDRAVKEIKNDTC